MDSLLALPLILLLVLAFVGLSASVGVDSRDGFTDDRLVQPYR
jgi:hypothetical protein